MKKTIFSKLLLIALFLVGVSASAQVRVKTNKGRTNKKVVVKTNRGNYSNHHNYRQNVRVKTNRNRVVVSKPNRPRVIVNRPTYNRAGYIWVAGFWKWNVYYGSYTWQKARWKRVKRNHMWVPGFWEISPRGFFWVEGYWALEY
jgi:hypothetical protein